MNAAFSLRTTGVLALAACITASAAGAPKVGVLLKAKSSFWNAAEAGAVTAGETLGAEIISKAPMREADISVQIQFLNGLVAEGVNAIVIAPSSRELLVEPIAAAMAKGVKVVVIDTELADAVGTTFVGTDQTEAGRAAGRLLAGLIADGDEVAIFKHSQTSGATALRETGALEVMRETRPGLVFHANVYASSEAGGEAGGELKRAAFLLQRYPKTKAILASSTPGTMGMLQVLQEKGLAGSIRFVGFGFNLNPTVAEAIESGAMDGWVAQLPGEMGSLGVRTALQLLEGKSLPPVVNTEFVVVTKSNLADPKIQALLGP
jgi:ribose transport system substrate-binding protein